MTSPSSAHASPTRCITMKNNYPNANSPHTPHSVIRSPSHNTLLNSPSTPSIPSIPYIPTLQPVQINGVQYTNGAVPVIVVPNMNLMNTSNNKTTAASTMAPPNDKIKQILEKKRKGKEPLNDEEMKILESAVQSARQQFLLWYQQQALRQQLLLNNANVMSNPNATITMQPQAQTPMAQALSPKQIALLQQRQLLQQQQQIIQAQLALQMANNQWNNNVNLPRNAIANNPYHVPRNSNPHNVNELFTYFGLPRPEEFDKIFYNESKQDDDDDEDMTPIEEAVPREGLFDGAYDLEAIIRYLLIPKSTSYNALFRDDWYKSHEKVHWGGDTRMSYSGGYSFLTQFGGLPQFSSRADNAFFERFFEYLFTEEGTKYWTQFIENKDNISDENVLKFLHIATTDPASIIPTFGQYIDGKFIEKMRLRSIINNAMQLGELDDNIKRLKELDGYSYVSNLKDEVLIEFDAFKNAKSFGLKDAIQIFVNMKNVTDVTVKVFEINTKSYYRDKEQEIETDMNLDGLSASHEWVLSNKHIGLRNSYHKKQITIDFPKALNGTRGVYFVDVISNGRHARSVIKIGDIRFVSRVCEAGHVFQLLDEESKVIQNGSIFMSKHVYKTDENAQIFIPFTTRGQSSQQIILERADDATFNILSTFDHQTEHYAMQCGIYVDREQLLEKKRASIVVRAGLFLNGHRVTNALLENCKLSVKLKTGDGVDVDKTFSNFQLNDDKESIATFTVPNEPRAIAIRLDAQVKNMSQNTKQSLSQSASFKMNSIDNSSNIGQMFLIPQFDGAYIVALYGKNGEGIGNKDIELTLDSKYFKSTLSFKLTTDDKGRVYLPPRLNDDFVRLRASCAAVDGIRCDWDLNDGIEYCDTPNILHMTTNASVCIPYAPAIKPKKEFQLAFGLTDKYYIQSYALPQHLQYDAATGYIIIKDLPAGDFILKCLDLDYDINIYVTECGQLMDDERYNVNKNEIVQLSPLKPLQISKMEQIEAANVLKIELNGVNERTRVHVLAAHMISRFSIATYLNCIDPLSLSTKTMASSTNFYLPQRMIGEELRYILEREKAKTFIGNSLIRPSFLVKPLEHKATSTKTQTAKAGGDIQKRSMAARDAMRSSPRRRKEKERVSGQSPNDDRYNIEFIGATCALIANQKPDIESGLLEVDLSSLSGNQTFVRVIAFDEDNCVIRGLALKAARLDGNIKEYSCPQYEYTDNRLTPGLNPKYQYVDERNVVLLRSKDDDYVLDDFKTSQIETYQSFGDMFNLIQTISGNHELKIDWSFLTQWNVLSEQEKMKKYDKFFCHELHLFLKKKDKTFFDRVCRPLIASKLNKDFLDCYLLDDRDALRKYCDLERFQSLNPLEKILLAHAFKAEKKDLASSLLKFYEAKQDSMEVDPQRFDTLFRTALATKAMDDAPTIQQNIAQGMDEKCKEEDWCCEMDEEEDDWGDDGGEDWGDDDADEMEMDDCCDDSDDAACFGDDSSSDFDDDDDDESEEEDDSSSDDESPKRKKKSKHSKHRHKAMRFGSHAQKREQMQQIQLFKQVEQTKEYQETYYHKILFEQSTTNLISLNKFWASFGIQMLRDDTKPFLSQYFLFATASINEILCVLAVLDMPFNAQNVAPQFKFGEKGINDRSVRLIAQSPTILFAKELKKQQQKEEEEEESKEDEEAQAQSISIHVVYFDPSDRYTTDENGERMDKFVNKYEFRPGKIYGCLAILTNVSSIRQRIEILCQIPTGSIPVNAGFTTKTNFITLSAYSVHKFEFYFYYPVVGAFRQYPIVVTKKNKIIGSSKQTKTDPCRIVVKYEDKDKKVDRESWNDVSLNGSNEDILNYLATHNLNKLDMTRIYYKMNKDKAFYDELVKLLRAQGYYNSSVWAIQFYYLREAIKGKATQQIQDRSAMVQEYLSMNGSFKSKLSPHFKSPQFEYDDLNANKYNYLEYIPLVNARAHLLGQKREILNDAFKTQYQKCLNRCAYRSTSVLDLKYDDVLSLLYYLLLQDRIEEALDVYAIVNANKALKQEVERKVPICFDYFNAYMALFVDNEEGIDRAIDVATEIAAKYRDASLISSKRKLFEDIEVLLSDLNDYKREDEDDKDAVVHGIGDRDRAMDKLAKNTPSLDFVIEKSDRKLIISSANVGAVTINFYTMNTEILFSNSPFFEANKGSDSGNKSAFAYIAPNVTHQIEIKEDEANESERTEFAIPSELKNTNLFVQVISSTLNVSKPFYDHELNVLVKESYGQLKVLVPSTKNKKKLIPLQKAYVKVYSQTNGGANEFYKDGYTDIRGKFDYASISTDQLNKTQKFAIFVKAPGYGSMIKECKPPKR
eukprot:1038317_1